MTRTPAGASATSDQGVTATHLDHEEQLPRFTASARPYSKGDLAYPPPAHGRGRIQRPTGTAPPPRGPGALPRSTPVARRRVARGRPRPRGALVSSSARRTQAAVAGARGSSGPAIAARKPRGGGLTDCPQVGRLPPREWCSRRSRRRLNPPANASERTSAAELVVAPAFAAAPPSRATWPKLSMPPTSPTWP